MRQRLFWAAVIAALLVLDLFLCLFRMGDMLGNLEAQMVIITPGFIVSHWLHRRRADRQHAERMADQAALHAKVDALHQHLGVPSAD